MDRHSHSNQIGDGFGGSELCVIADFKWFLGSIERIWLFIFCEDHYYLVFDRY